MQPWPHRQLSTLAPFSSRLCGIGSSTVVYDNGRVYDAEIYWFEAGALALRSKRNRPTASTVGLFMQEVMLAGITLTTCGPDGI